MRIAAWIVVGSVGAALAAIGLSGGAAAREILLGMLGPLVAVTVSWVATERVHQRRPERVTGLMLAAFGVKMVFFGVYLGIMLKLLKLQPIPFVASFTTYFIALYAVEAVCLQRLFTHR